MISLRKIINFFSPPDKNPNLERIDFQNPLKASSIRNNQCICGSGKKVKKCHGVKTTLSHDEYNEMINLARKTLAKESSKEA